MATNRADTLDPALLRSGRLDRKIEFPLPNESARARILEIHSRKMTLKDDVNFEELARSTDEFNAAQLKAVCVEAGMIALREGSSSISHEHFHSGIAEGEFPILLRDNETLIVFCFCSTKQKEEGPYLFCLSCSCYAVSSSSSFRFFLLLHSIFVQPYPMQCHNLRS